jgi:hypothetical protein
MFHAELQQRTLAIAVPEGRESVRLADVPAGKRLVIEHVCSPSPYLSLFSLPLMEAQNAGTTKRLVMGE